MKNKIKKKTNILYSKAVKDYFPNQFCCQVYDKQCEDDICA